MWGCGVNSAGSSSAAGQAMNFLPDKNSEFVVRPGDRDSSVGIETRCGLDWSGIVGQSGQEFHTLQDRPIDPPSLLNKEHRVSSPSVKWPGHGVTLPPTSSTEAEERVGLKLCCPSWPSWPVLRWTLLTPFLACCITVRFSLTKILLHAVHKTSAGRTCTQSEGTVTAICSLSFSYSCYLTHLFTPVSNTVRRHHTAGSSAASMRHLKEMRPYECHTWRREGARVVLITQCWESQTVVSFGLVWTNRTDKQVHSVVM